MKNFKYKMVIGNPAERMLDDAEMLNTYCDEGWELVSVVYPVKPKNEGIGAKAALYYLKREIKDANN